MPDGRKLHRASTEKLLELPTNGTPGAWPPTPNSPASAFTSSTCASCHPPPPAKPPASPSPKWTAPTQMPP